VALSEAEQQKLDADARKKGRRKIVVNIYNTNYEVIEEAAVSLGFKVVSFDHMLRPSQELIKTRKELYGVHNAVKPEEFDIVWFDLSINPDIVQKLQNHQRIS